MPVTCANQNTLTDNDLLLNFTTSTTTGILPSVAPSATDRDSRGMLTNTAINQLITGLKNAAIIPTASQANVDTYSAKKDQFVSNVSAEYCFYMTRYKYALTKLFTAVRTAYGAPSDANKATVTQWLESTKTFNQKLNDFIQLVAAISGDMLSTSDRLQTEMSALNTELAAQRGKLEEQNKIIMSNDAVTKIQKQMVRYSEEKARRTDNLLNMYSFLNVFALGLLVYVYKAAGDE
jgi:hypothetical protein